MREVARWLLMLCAFALCLNARAAPQRIVSLLPSLTETVCALDACDRLVGVDNFSNWPERVRALPHVGGLDDVNIETVLSLKPDLVLLTATSRALPRLKALGVNVLGLEIKTLPDVQRALQRVGEVLGSPESARVWARMNEGIDEAARAMPAALRGTTVYFEVDSGPYGASGASHIGELLTRLGAANIVPARLGSVPKLNPEFVVRADPQVIMLSHDSAQSVAARPGWNRIRAVRDGRVCAFTTAQSDVIARPGPRMAEAARILADCLRGRLKSAGS
jgi:iron complex transport system substrate-binding protein